MEINTHKHQMVGDTINDAAVAAFPARHARELTVSVVERIGTDMQHHPDHVDADIAVKIKMSRQDSADAGQKAHSRRRQAEPREKPSQPESYRPVKMNIENSLHFASFVSVFDVRNER